LRNTYWLLALSLLPTVLGAWLGVATGITQALTGGMGLIVFLGGAFGFMFAIEKTKNSAAGVPVLLAFTFFMGLMLSRLIAMVLGFKNGSEPDHDGLWRHRRRVLRDGQPGQRDQARPVGHGQVAVRGRPGADGRRHHQRVRRLHGGHDGHQHDAGHRHLQRLHAVRPQADHRWRRTNYISATLALYLDIFNVFQSLLALLGIMGGERD
jgi:modulator of FtsH protease